MMPEEFKQKVRETADNPRIRTFTKKDFIQAYEMLEEARIVNLREVLARKWDR